jgi:hypothetical protein
MSIDWGTEPDTETTEPTFERPASEPVQVADTRGPMKLKDRNLRFALLKAVADGINTELAIERDSHTYDLVERYEDDGVKSMDVKLPSGTKVAAISLSVPKATTEVVDEQALVAYAKESAPWLLKDHHHPAVPEQVIPAQAAYTEQILDREALAEWIKTVKPVEPSAGGPVVNPDSGEVVDGILHTPEGKPRSFSVRYATDGRDDLARAWRAGELEHLTADSILPALGDGQ